MEVLAGNHTLKATRLLADRNPHQDQWQHIDCWIIDVDDDRAARIVVADNRTADLGDYDTDQLLDLLGDLDETLGLDGTGYTDDDIAKLLDGIPPTEDSDTDPAPTLTDRFGTPPFTVLDARTGTWQDRKRAWIAQNIESQKGRDTALTYASPQDKYHNWYQVKNRAEKVRPGITTQEILDEYSETLEEYTHGTGTSTFDPVLAEILYSWHSNPGDRILDPWAGGSVRGLVAAHLGRHYTGCELRQEQIDENLRQQEMNALDTGTETTWIVGDSRTTIPTLTNHFDMIIGCPPYYDLEKYSDSPNDLSNLTTEEFNHAIADTLAKCDKVLSNNRFACFVVGAVRDKRGNLRDMKKCMIDAAPTGWTLANDAVLLNPVGTAAIRAGKQFSSTRVLARVHQDIVVFTKGDRKTAARRLDPVEIIGLEEQEGERE